MFGREIADQVLCSKRRQHLIAYEKVEEKDEYERRRVADQFDVRS